MDDAVHATRVPRNGREQYPTGGTVFHQEDTKGRWPERRNLTTPMWDKIGTCGKASRYDPSVGQTSEAVPESKTGSPLRNATIKAR